MQTERGEMERGEMERGEQSPKIFSSKFFPPLFSNFPSSSIVLVSSFRQLFVAVLLGSTLSPLVYAHPRIYRRFFAQNARSLWEF
jgi:hypothetical protein